MKRPSYKTKKYAIKSMQFDLSRNTVGEITLQAGSDFEHTMTFTPKEARKIARKMLRWARKGTA